VIPVFLASLASSQASWLAARQTTIASNVANANTPGYQVRDVTPFAASREERAPARAARKPRSPSVGREIPPIAREVVSSLLARATGPLNPSLIKETIVRKEPDFDEREQGFSTFMRLLQEMERQGLLKRQQLNGRQWYVLPPDAAPSTPEAPHESSEAASEES